MWSLTLGRGDGHQRSSSQALFRWRHGDLEGRAASKLPCASTWLPTLAETDFVFLNCFLPREIERVAMGRQVSNHKSYPQCSQKRRGEVEPGALVSYASFPA